MLGPMLAFALEIGAPHTNPVLGDSLRLEIPLTLAAGGKAPRSDCARLVPRPDDAEGDYFPKETRATIEPRRGGAVLIVTSARGVSSPVVGFRVLIGCDAGVSRDFMLLASQREIIASVTQGTTSAVTPAATPAAEAASSRMAAAKANEMVMSRNTTLNKLARARYPSSRETRDEYRRLMAEANPELFANAGDQVGSVPLPAGTILKVPGGLPKSATRIKKEAAEQASNELPQAGPRAKAEGTPQAQNPPAEERAPRGTSKKTDRLVIGGGQGRVPSLSQQELKQSLDRLEQMMGEKSQGDIAMSETLTSLAASFGEVKTYLQGVDERIKRAEAEQVRAQAELQSLREELRNSYSLVELVIAIIGGGAIGAALIAIFQRLTTRPQPVPFGAANAYAGAAASGSAPATDATQPAAAPAQQQNATPVRTAEAAANVSTPPIRGNRLEPTTKNTKSAIERAAGQAANAAPETIPDKFASIKKSTVEQASERPAHAAAPTEAPRSHVDSGAPESTFEIELPKTGPAETTEPAETPQATSGPELPATERDLELRLGESEADLAEKSLAGPGVDPVLELADVMTSLDLAKEAASAVLEHIRQHPHQDPSHWFKVLEIYRNTGHRDAFDEAVQELRQNLNVAVDEWGTDPSKAEKTSLENYPHLARELQALWPKPECDEFLTKLLEDNRGGKRAGFPQSVAEEIVLLKAILRNAPQIDFPPIGGTDGGEEDPALAESKAWREVRLIP